MNRGLWDRLRKSAFGPLLPFAARCLRGSSKGRWPGVRSPAPRSRGTVCGLHAACLQRGVLVRNSMTPRMGACARTPSHLPGHSGGMPRRGRPPSAAAGRWWCPRAQAPFAVSSTFAGRKGVDATALNRHRRCPASVGRRTGAPPSPWGRSPARQNLRGQAALGRNRAVESPT